MKWWENFKGDLGPYRGRGQIPDHWTKYEFTVDWFLRHIDCWNEYLRPWLDFRKPKHALEIGCYEGMSTIWLRENLSSDCKLYPVDIFPKTIVFENFEKNTRGLGILPSIMTSDNFFKCKGREYEFIYIDGSHESDCVYRDFLNSFECLASGGIILIDDFYHSDDLQDNGVREVMIKVRQGVVRAFGELGVEVKRLGQCVCYIKE
jgi:predicted O-methyltransferase YrrM